MKLTPKQKIFVREYLVDLNATQAAIRTGYSEKTARFIGCENLTKPHIQQAIHEQMQKHTEKLDIQTDDILRELKQIAFSNIGDFITWGPQGVAFKASDEISKELMACIADVQSTPGLYGTTIKFKLHDKKAALELLGKYKKMWVEKHELGVDKDDPLMDIIRNADGKTRGLPAPAPEDEE